MSKIFLNKLSARTDKYRFIGYPQEGIGYLFYHPSEQKIFVSRHAIFLKKEFIQEKRCGRIIELREVQNLQSTSSYP